MFKYDASQITESIIKNMKYGGLNPKGSIILRFVGYFNVACSMLITVLLTLNFIFEPHNNIVNLIDESVMFVGFIQVIVPY